MGLFKILSIDGGGMRCIQPLTLLAEIERRTGKPVYKLFDLITGTSSGGMIALALVLPDPVGILNRFSAWTLLSLYREWGLKIFKPSLWSSLKSAFGVIDQKYSSQPLEEILTRVFGNWPLSCALTDVLIPAYDIQARSPVMFKSKLAKAGESLDPLMWQVARATTAAPTFFEPFPLGSQTFIDGGVVVNNPSLCAAVDAFTLFEASESDLLVVSLGAGTNSSPIPYRSASSWGALGWARPLLSVLMEGQAEIVDYHKPS